MSYAGYDDYEPTAEVETLAPGIQRVTEPRGQRYYVWTKPDGTVWKAQGFSTIFNGGWTKDWLNPWSIKMIVNGVIKEVHDDPEFFVKRILKDPEGSAKWMKGFIYAAKPSQRAIGSAVHAATEALDLGQPIPSIYADEVTTEHVDPYLEQYARFIEDFKPVIVANEAPVINEKSNYAGTLDRILDITDPSGRTIRLLTDIKTGAGVYPETAIQLNAYARAEWIGLPDGVVPMLEVDGLAVLWLRPDAYQLMFWPMTDDIFDGFRFVREVYRVKRDILGPLKAHPIEPGQLIISDYLKDPDDD
jgi:hypothetical protein